jgi:DNA-binding CsgD family transcriptional regulator
VPEAPSLPWALIHDYLLEVGSARSEAKFHWLVHDRMQGLIPNDGGLSAITGPEHDPARGVRGVYWSGDPQVLKDFNAYYRFRQPFSQELLCSDWTFDYDRYRDTEFVQDYMNRIGIRHTLGRPAFKYCIGLNRGRTSGGFSDQEVAIFKVITPHLNTLCRHLSTISRLRRMAVSRSELVGRRGVLSRREAEIVLLMSRRMTSSEIASLLFISPRTVEHHVANVYRKLNVNNRAQLLSMALADQPTLMSSEHASSPL